MNERLNRYQWPSLPGQYGAALKDAVSYVFSRAKPVGIVAAGSIIRGNPDSSSDLDLVVLDREVGQRAVYRYFCSVPTEIFLHSADQIEQILETERAGGAPFLAHMLATGFVVYELDGAVSRLRRKAEELLARGPASSPEYLLQKRYAAVTLLEDALDIAGSDPEMCRALLTRAVEETVRFQFWQAGHWQPRHKEAFQALDALNPPMGHLVREFYRATGHDESAELARQIVHQGVGATGFFEWESGPMSLEGDG